MHLPNPKKPPGIIAQLKLHIFLLLKRQENLKVQVPAAMFSLDYCTDSILYPVISTAVVLRDPQSKLVPPCLRHSTSTVQIPILASNRFQSK